jgi:hypothetical protein
VPDEYTMYELPHDFECAPGCIESLPQLVVWCIPTSLSFILTLFVFLSFILINHKGTNYTEKIGEGDTDVTEIDYEYCELAQD